MIPYLVERVDESEVVLISRCETERRAFYVMLYQPPGEYRVRHGDRIICRVLAPSRALVPA